MKEQQSLSKWILMKLYESSLCKTANIIQPIKLPETEKLLKSSE